MTSEGLGEMFEGDSADTCAEQFPLVSIGGQAEGLACADPGARTPIGVSGIFFQTRVHPTDRQKLPLKTRCQSLKTGKSIFLLVLLKNPKSIKIKINSQKT